MVRLQPMTGEQFKAFIEFVIPAYAKDKVESGAWREEESLQLSREGYARLLPQGLDTAGMYLYMIQESSTGENVGYLWLHLPGDAAQTGNSEAFLYEIAIFEPHQGRGLGKATMAAMEAEAARLGATAVSLHVFGHNARALGLYSKTGYQVTDYQMSKQIGH